MNHIPTDPPIFPLSGNPKVQPDVSEQDGQLTFLFFIFVYEVSQKLIVLETNRYASQHIRSKIMKQILESD